MKHRLNSKSEQNTEAQAAHVPQHDLKQRLDFKSTDELIRFDMARTAPPAGLRERVLGEIEKERPKRAWWRRWWWK